MVLAVILTNAARNGTAVGERIAHAETYHGIFASRAFGKFAKEFAHHLEGVAIVEVVAVEHGKGFFNHVLTHHNGVVRTPGLRATLGAGEAFGQRIEGLEHEFARNVAFVLRKHLVAKFLFKVLTDYEHKFAEAGVNGVVDGVVHDCFAVRAEAIQLFEAAVTAAHACCKQEKRWFHSMITFGVVSLLSAKLQKNILGTRQNPAFYI